MAHLETYRFNAAYTEFLERRDVTFYSKYVDALRPHRMGARVLDVGCGVGQTIAQLSETGYQAIGVDVSASNLASARKSAGFYHLYDGTVLPFPDDHFASVGALNVLEHVEEPESFLRELVRVAAVGGKVVVSSPNFLRVLGPGYHPRMRGLANKWRNMKLIRRKRREISALPSRVRFERMTPTVTTPFKPDDDAIVVTNPFEIEFFLRRYGCGIEKNVCTDRYVSKPLDFLLNLTPLRHLMFNAFVVARKTRERSCPMGTVTSMAEL